MKEIRIRPRIEEHDLLVKIKNIKRLLVKHDVRVNVIFRGRELLYMDTGEKILDRIVKELGNITKIVSRGKKGNICTMFLAGSNKHIQAT